MRPLRIVGTGLVIAAIAVGCSKDESPPVFTSTTPGSIDEGVVPPHLRTTTSTTEDARPRPNRLSPVTAAVLKALGAVQTSEGISVPVSGDVLFDSGSATLRPESARIVSDLASAAEQLPEAQVRVTGHTDDQGGTAFNQTLSEQRAKAMADALRAKDASLGARLDIAGRGETQPIAPNTTPEGRQKNRRVEVLFVGARL